MTRALCPFCQSQHTNTQESGKSAWRWRVVCVECKAAGPLELSAAKAERAWDGSRDLTLSNEALS